MRKSKEREVLAKQRAGCDAAEIATELALPYDSVCRVLASATPEPEQPEPAEPGLSATELLQQLDDEAGQLEELLDELPKPHEGEFDALLRGQRKALHRQSREWSRIASEGQKLVVESMRAGEARQARDLAVSAGIAADKVEQSVRTLRSLEAQMAGAEEIGADWRPVVRLEPGEDPAAWKRRELRRLQAQDEQMLTKMAELDRSAK